jgi:type I restriction enzyme S subunit
MESASWQLFRLSDIADIEKSAVQPSEIVRGTTFVGLESINQSGTVDTTRTVVSGELLSTKFRFTNRHILYGKLRPYLKKIGRPACDGICSTDILPILPKETVDRDFLYYFLRQPQLIKLATERAIGANLPRLSPATLAEFEIAVPPFPIQKKIAAILDKADAAREKRRDANRLIDRFLQSVFREMFGGDKYRYVKLHEVCTKITDGTHVTPNYVTEGVPFLSVKDVKTGYIDWNATKFISSDQHREITKRVKPEKDDILYTKVGTIGVASFVDVNTEFSIFVSVALLKPDKAAVEPIFLKWMMNTDLVKRQALRRVKGIGVPDLHLVEIRDFDIILPLQSEQQKFGALVEKVESLRAKQKESEKELENLFNSLMQRAFKGELVQ